MIAVFDSMLGSGHCDAPYSCKHASRKSRCKQCQGAQVCPHSRVRSQCKDCCGASICPHGRIKSQCKLCGGASICTHGRRKSMCKECKGASICCHGRQRSHCKECGGISLCMHGRIRSQCRECGGASFCIHGRRRSKCRDCKMLIKPSNITSQPLWQPETFAATTPRYLLPLPPYASHEPDNTRGCSNGACRPLHITDHDETAEGKRSAFDMLVAAAAAAGPA
jgi:hypothetical protein